MAEHDRDTHRGKRATFDPVSGEVFGSGANAGGGDNPGEDYDSDPQGGGGAEPVGGPRPADEAAPAPRDKFQGGPN